MNTKCFVALVNKERKQMLREPSNVLIGIIIPVMMLLIFGYGLNMDVKNIPIAVVNHEYSEASNTIINHFQNSEYFNLTIVNSSSEGEKAIKEHKVDACVFLPDNLMGGLQSGKLQILVAINSTNATMSRNYDNCIRQVLRMALAKYVRNKEPGVSIVSRMWFNDANESCYYLVPGVIVIIMALIGCMLTALQMAKEYEQGTMESMFVTPMTSGEILLAKMVNNYLLGITGLFISLLFARYLFEVPIRGNIFILFIGSSLFLMTMMAVGLVISSVTKSQFLAAQIAMIVSFLPVFMLSGFIYEIPNMPTALQYFTLIIPARYYVDFLQTIFLVGNVWSNIITNLGVLTLFTVVLLLLAKIKNPKLVG